MEVGRIIGGKYRLVREVGEGRAGSVWAAEHETLGRAVAIKLLVAPTADAKAASRFVEEATCAARVKHRFVVDVFDFGITEDGISYMVQELLEGHELSDCMCAGPAWDVRDVVEFAIHCLNGLEAVHRAGIVHRDLKPENVFVVLDDGKRYPKLLEFGFSKLSARRAREVAAVPSTGAARSKAISRGLRVGTPSYMSPELLRGASALDGRSDLYSMGVILYQWLTGFVPYPEEDAGVLAQQIEGANAAPLSALRPDLGRGLSDAIARALAPDPGQRFASATDMGAALAALLPSLPEASSVVQEWATSKPAIDEDTPRMLRAASTSSGDDGDDGEEVRLPVDGLGSFGNNPWLIGAVAAALLIFVSMQWMHSARTPEGKVTSERSPVVEPASFPSSGPKTERALAVAPAVPESEPDLPAPDQALALPVGGTTRVEGARTEETPREPLAVVLPPAPKRATASDERRRTSGLTAPRGAPTRTAPAAEPARAPSRAFGAEPEEGVIRKLDF